MNLRGLFLQHVAQTSDAPLAIEVASASGCIITDTAGKEYIDLIGGISVANVGHGHPAVLEAIRTQLDKYLHVMVYGEFIQSPQVQYAQQLAAQLPSTLNTVYFTNSGAEAVEGAMKLAKRVTGRPGIAAFQNSYHGSTQGALSIIGSEYWRNAFRPLLPAVDHFRYNNYPDLQRINQHTACVVAETIQAEAGVIPPDPKWITALRDRCTEVGALLVLDEIQAGFGRTGTTWAFEQFNIVPDILLLGKALGGGMPLGAFIASRELMWQLTNAPVLGHITTFGGHPVSCVAGLAAFNVILSQEPGVEQKTKLFRELLVHEKIKSFRSAGLLIALEFENFDTCKRIIDHCIRNGVITDWFLFAPQCLRIAPPLTITEAEIRRSCAVLVDAINQE